MFIIAVLLAVSAYIIIQNKDKKEDIAYTQFIKDIDEDVLIFYHYGSYYRKYKDFNIDNLGRVDI